MDYTKHFSTKKVTQDQKLPGSNQVKNSDGCYVWGVDDWQRLNRFLILGSEGGSYYASERKLTTENAEAVLRCIKSDGGRAVAAIVEVSDLGKAPKNDPAIFALAMAAKLGDESTRRAAYAAMPRVCRIPTHLFTFVKACEAFGGWGRGLRNSVGRWYTEKNSSQLAYHLAKYQQRDGWSNRDLLRLAHVTPKTPLQNQLFKWVVSGELPTDATAGEGREDLQALQFIEGFERLKKAKTAAEAAALIQEFNLSHEMVPTELKTSAVVWEALFQRMPLGAMIRNLGNLSKCGFLKPLSAASKEVSARLLNGDNLKKARIHPIQILVALRTYSSGKGFKGTGTWDVVPVVCDALEEAFYLAFQFVEPSGTRDLLCLDTSQSMTWSHVGVMGGLTPREISAAMAMVVARTSNESLFISYSDTATELAFTPKWRLKEVVDRIGKYPAYGTDCASPIVHALNRGYDVDTIQLYTDSETNSRGSLQPVAALNKLRDKLGHDVKLIIAGMVSNGFSVADPNDRSMLDIIGYSTDTPAIISQFSAGKI